MRPTVCDLADQVHTELATVTDPDGEATGWAGLALVHALFSPLQVVEDLARDDAAGRPGIEAVLDPARCPPSGLRWLGQLKGVRVTPSDPADSMWVRRARDQIGGVGGLRRGTPAAIAAAAKMTLTGTRYVGVFQRNPVPFAQTVRTRTTETPDAAQTLAAILAQTPAWVKTIFVVSDSPLIDEGTRTIDAATATVDAATLADVT